VINNVQITKVERAIIECGKIGTRNRCIGCAHTPRGCFEEVSKIMNMVYTTSMPFCKEDEPRSSESESEQQRVTTYVCSNSPWADECY